MNKLIKLREYFKLHCMISFLVDVIMAIILISLSIFMFGRMPGAFIGFFIYIVFSNVIGTNISIINPDIFGRSNKAK